MEAMNIARAERHPEEDSRSAVLERSGM